jgi:hypothetical protein
MWTLFGHCSVVLSVVMFVLLIFRVVFAQLATQRRQCSDDVSTAQLALTDALVLTADRCCSRVNTRLIDTPHVFSAATLFFC